MLRNSKPWFQTTFQIHPKICHSSCMKNRLFSQLGYSNFSLFYAMAFTWRVVHTIYKLSTTHVHCINAGKKDESCVHFTFYYCSEASLFCVWTISPIKIPWTGKQVQKLKSRTLEHLKVWFIWRCRYGKTFLCIILSSDFLLFGNLVLITLVHSKLSHIHHFSHLLPRVEKRNKFANISVTQ